MAAQRSSACDVPAVGDDALAVFTSLARTALLLEALQAECLEPHGLSFTEYAVLRLLTAEGAVALSPSRLAEAVLTSSGGMTKIIDRLERSGLVQRSSDPHDRRGVLVAATARGRATGAAASASYVAGRLRVLERLTPKERAAIGTGLQRLLGAFEADRSSLG